MDSGGRSSGLHVDRWLLLLIVLASRCLTLQQIWKKLVNSNKGLKILILTKMLCVFLVQILLFKFQHTVFFKFNFSILLLFPVPTCRHCSSDCCRVHSWFSRPPQTRLKNFAIVPTCRHYSSDCCRAHSWCSRPLQTGTQQTWNIHFQWTSSLSFFLDFLIKQGFSTWSFQMENSH